MKLVILLAVVSTLTFVVAQRGDLIAQEGHHYPTHHHHEQGRVQIKTYRGASKQHGHGWGSGWFAPYGYWVRQPADGWGWNGWSG